MMIGSGWLAHPDRGAGLVLARISRLAFPRAPIEVVVDEMVTRMMACTVS
jgi:hypothetical protein